MKLYKLAKKLSLNGLGSTSAIYRRLLHTRTGLVPPEAKGSTEVDETTAGLLEEELVARPIRQWKAKKKAANKNKANKVRIGATLASLEDLRALLRRAVALAKALGITEIVIEDGKATILRAVEEIIK